jgi:prepilin-type N-terminal cleavage/methylation domain-containing protein
MVRKRSGVTLIELLVTITISTILLAALTYTFVNFGRSALIESSVTDVQADVHSALAFMTDELRRARYIYNTDETSNRTDRLYLNPINPATEADLEKLGQVIFDKSELIQANSPGFRILLAFWVPCISGTSRLPKNQSSPAEKGTPLAFSVSKGELVAWGTPASIPAYNLVVYYVTDPPPKSAWIGPRLLERWESEPTPIRFEEFVEAETPERFLSTDSLDVTSAPPIDSIYLRKLPPADASSFALADFMSNDEGIVVNYLSPQTVAISLKGSLEGSQAERYLKGSSTAETYLKSNVGDALSASTTVVARNVCVTNTICVKDP